MSEYDLEMNGHLIGPEYGFFCSELDLSELDWRDQDADVPGGDGRLFGRDYATAGPITLTLESMADDVASAKQDMRALMSAWRWTDGRSTPGAYTSLSATIAGERSTFYGRPRKIKPDVSGGSFHSGGVTLTAEFVPMIDLVFLGTGRQVDITILGNQDQGLEFPAEAPFFFEGEQRPREGQIVNGGTEPVPFTARFYGPVSNPSIQSDVGGWEIALDTTIAYDQVLIVDTLGHTVTREEDGASFSHALTYSSDLSALLPAGMSEVFYRGTDSSNTAHVIIEWSEGTTGI